MRIAAPRATLGLVLLLCLGLVGLAPVATAAAAEVATTTSVALTSPRQQVIGVAISVAAADGSASDGVVDVAIRSEDGTFDENYGRYPVDGTTFRATFSVPRRGTFVVEASYTPSSSTYAPSTGTGTITLRQVPPTLLVTAGDLGNGVLEATASVQGQGGAEIRGGSFVFRTAGRAPVTVANDGNAAYARFERLALGRSYTVTATFQPPQGSDLPSVTGEETTRLTEERHTTFIGALVSTPRRGVVRFTTFMVEDYPKHLTGRVTIRDRRTGRVVARIDRMRYVLPDPGIVRTITGVDAGPRAYQLHFTPDPRFRAIAKDARSRVYRVDVR